MKADQAAAVIKEMEKEVLTMFRLEHLNIVSLLGVTDGEWKHKRSSTFPSATGISHQNCPLRRLLL